jgi:hypothetical protein
MTSADAVAGVGVCVCVAAFAATRIDENTTSAAIDLECVLIVLLP